jgi:hypothetical protein
MYSEEDSDLLPGNIIHPTRFKQLGFSREWPQVGDDERLAMEC